MYTSFAGARSRSRSTADIFRSGSYLDASHQPMTTFSTLSRPEHTANPNRRRRSEPEAPAPAPLRSPADAAKRPRSQPTDDASRQLVASATSTVQASQSPGSKNFVKKLVAALERRQREQEMGAEGMRGGEETESEMYRKPHRELGLSREERNTMPGTRGQEISWELSYRYESEIVVSRPPPATQLEDLRERDNESDVDVVDDWLIDTAEEPPSQFWEQEEHVAPLPIYLNNDSHLGHNDNPPKPTIRRTLKTMLSSILNWKHARGLPKGTREYYATRDSLGEEMRAFRHDTMPRLVEHAKVKDRRQQGREENESRDQREFTKIIESPRSLDEETTRPSVATIRPIYGAGKAHVQRILSWGQEPQSSDDQQEFLCRSVSVQAAAASPPRAPPSSPEYPPRPSRVGDLPCDPFPVVQHGRVQATFDRASIVYDVPRTSRGTPEEDAGDRRERGRTPPEYANVIGGLIAGDDKRLNCTAFTTF